MARLNGLDLARTTSSETLNRAYRLALGVNGNITPDITFDVGAVANHTDLRRTNNGFNFIQRLLDVVADGTYNFVNPALTPQSVIDYLQPTNISNSTSDQYQIQASFTATPVQLPGGPLKLAAGGTIRYEAINAPSFNSDANGPTQRYFTTNAFGTSGSRTIYSGFGEVNIPILSLLTINASGRYDSYSSGQSAFSPKVSALFTPIRQLSIRGSWSRGFRIPAFAEANALPTTGFVTNNVSLFNNAYLAQYGCTTATFNTCPTYIRLGSYGQTTLASPTLQPERSRAFNVGFDFTPISNITISVDYYNIRKTDVITQPSNAPALAAYYTGQPIPAGYNVIADAPDPNFPNATPRVAFVQSQLINANSFLTDGLDFRLQSRFEVFGITWRSNFDASYILRLTQTFPDGTVERYDGSLGNFNLTSGNGTSKLRGNWQNSFEFSRNFSLTGTANYYGGYNLSAQDQGTGYLDCGLSPLVVTDASGNITSGYCNVPAYVTFDLNGTVRINDRFTLSITALNLFDNLPPVDPVTYGANYYNAVQSGNQGILGRYFRVSITTKF